MIAFVLAAVTGASPFQADARELDAIRDRIARERVRNHFLRRQEGVSLQAVVRLSRSIAERTREVDRLSARIAEVEAELAEAVQTLEVVLDRYASLRREAGRRAAAMHRIQRIGVEALLVGLADPLELRRAEDRFAFVLRHDRELAERVRSARDRRAEAVAEVGRRRQALENARERLEEERGQLALRVAERKELVRALRKERVRSDVLARVLRQAESGAVREGRRIRGHTPPAEPRAGGFEAQKGVLPWPSAGRVEVTFGRKVDPATGVVLEQTGIDLRAADGALVRVPFAGTVAAARWIPGFGHTIVVDHGEGWFTVYGHLQQKWTAAGRSVGRLQAIGTVGASGSTKGAYLYFEVRHGSVPQDPLQWLADD